MRRKLRFLIAYGPTEEPLDPVRFLSNYSTGVMGRHLIGAARARKHAVTAVECPKAASGARGLLSLLRKKLPGQDALLMAAAVCDVRPARFSAQKIKKTSLSSLRLVRNPDILAGLARMKKPGQIFIGFALESGDVLKNGPAKLKKKGLDLILAQKVGAGRNPFGERPVEAVLIGPGRAVRRLGRVRKKRVAQLLVREAERILAEK